MMRVRLKALSASAAGVFQPGHEVEVDEALAQALVKGGYAELLEAADGDEPEVPSAAERYETAALPVAEQAEHAVKPVGRPGRKPGGKQ